MLHTLHRRSIQTPRPKENSSIHKANWSISTQMTYWHSDYSVSVDHWLTHGHNDCSNPSSHVFNEVLASLYHNYFVKSSREAYKREDGFRSHHQESSFLMYLTDDLLYLNWNFGLVDWTLRTSCSSNNPIWILVHMNLFHKFQLVCKVMLNNSHISGTSVISATICKWCNQSWSFVL